MRLVSRYIGLKNLFLSAKKTFKHRRNLSLASNPQKNQTVVMIFAWNLFAIKI